MEPEIDLKLYKRHAHIQHRQERIIRLWKRRDRRSAHSRKWLRRDRKLQRAIHRCSLRMEKYGLYTAGWWVELYETMLEHEQ